ncbi:MAG: PDZ domain-containing protein [Luteitalea sp.]|nr:PDZ domain-containing protein [Luteitalea sp.]
MELLNRSRIALLTAVICAAAAGPAAAQPPDRPQIRPDLPPMVIEARGATIGVTVRDINPSDAERLKVPGGVLIDDVRANSPAEKSGLKRADVVTEFDGERVRSVRQFARLVSETPPGRVVKLAVMRDGRKIDASITPDSSRRADIVIDRDRLAAGLEDLQDRIPLPRDFDLPGVRGRLGVTVQALAPQLAEFFGVKQGLLVSAVGENTPASRGGLKAGDVIQTVDGRAVASRAALRRAMRDVSGSRELTIGIVRAKTESSLKVTLDTPGRQGRPARFTRGW